ncbi:hypothetical protein BT96DRAFT_360373 [Gymnopus androsaceus JB14]|uniref:Uncharacterized protein n=1 Tax=Gymnopus androsaceus JB14 TaxID=1447944 RepID=A0A6A4I0D5_9AGAR|nr:hypothetical protein BT96DRAFT_360373 [Gymnopus androsaceus JB14]
MFSGLKVESSLHSNAYKELISRLSVWRFPTPKWTEEYAPLYPRSVIVVLLRRLKSPGLLTFQWPTLKLCMSKLTVFRKPRIPAIESFCMELSHIANLRKIGFNFRPTWSLNLIILQRDTIVHWFPKARRSWEVSGEVV